MEIVLYLIYENNRRFENSRIIIFLSFIGSNIRLGLER